MRYLEITGGVPLHGSVDIQGSKNAVLPVLAASMLGDGGCVIENCPDIGDVKDLLLIMESLGCRIHRDGDRISINADSVSNCEITGKSVARIRSSVLFLGTLLGKMGKVVLTMPGGCDIGQRPIDLHIRSLEQLGAAVRFREGCCCEAEALKLTGGRIHLDLPSVGATENIILAAVMAEGITVIENAAREPEIDELCRFLNRRGGRICRVRSDIIRIQGVRRLHPVRYRMCGDRIVAGTYLLAAAATGGSVCIRNVPSEDLSSLLQVMQRMGVRFRRNDQGICLLQGELNTPVSYLETAPYPGFPTDLQSQLVAALSRVAGNSCICETVFERRFEAARRLQEMGADITIEGCCIRIRGVDSLTAAELAAPDLRGGAALVIGALQADGCTRIKRAEYIERGYEDICRDLRRLGARIAMREDIRQQDC